MRIFFPLLLMIMLSACTNDKTIHLLFDHDDPQASYAAGQLTQTFSEHDFTVIQNESHAGRSVTLGLSEELGAEAFEIDVNSNKIVIYGGDDRGLIYGALALKEQIENGASWEEIRNETGKPHLEFRAIKFNLPWETYRPTSALDQHIPTVKDLKYWEAFLDMMVENRFNVISLWNMHPYAFMIQSKNFPKASPWTQEEFEEWQHFYRELFRMAKERALDTYIVHWNIFVSEAFAENYGVAHENYYPQYYVQGDTSVLVKQYLRESVSQVLEEYPDLDGIGISHGEGMAGMTPLQRQEWVDEVLIAGMLDADRPVKLIHRVPFSSGLSSDPGVSKNVEVVTRDAMERLEDRFDGPIWVEMKFNWSHGHSTPKLEKVHGGQLGDTYFKPLPNNYKVTWQVRNEDFFALRWGVPDFIRDHIKYNAQEDYVGGYFTGSETYIPGLDYFTALDQPVDWTWAFERQWLYYKLWGRLLYDPETPDEVFQAEFNRRYGDAGNDLLQAYALASSTQLRLASLFDSRWDFTLYSEGFLALQGDSTKYIGLEALINQKTMASEYVSVGDFVKAELAGEGFAEDRITPPKLIAMLEKDNHEALRLVEPIDYGNNTSLRYEVADIQIWANLGLHLAEKLKGAIAYEKFRSTGEQHYQQEAINALTSALAYWDEVIAISRPLYKDMRLAHYNHNFFTANDDNWFHWEKVRGEVEGDLELVRGGE